ncbi:MAG: hypothetical protein K9N23_02990 [Akkermansiaceae bacterium]|nr:hypothetical protein [Akkermansiaceae bacterium]
MSHPSSLARTFIIGIVAWTVALAAAGAAVAIRTPFSSNMVLQRGKPVPVSGTAAANKGITVTFNGQTKTTTSDGAGKWQVSLDPMVAKTAGGNLAATETGANTVNLSNVVVGDVWICSGQSNMDMWLSSCNRQVDIDSANYPVIRQFRAPLVQSSIPLETVDGSWTVCSPSTAGTFSAVAFYFARKICQDQSSAIPLGLYLASVGGTTIDPWLAPDGATDIPVLAPLYSQSILPSGPFRLFNGMVFPYAPLPATGMIWYQGENAQSTTESADSYYLKMKALAQGYQRMLGMDDFAFYFVQLAYWGQQQTSPEPVLFSGGWDADTRIQQARAMALPHSGMASAMDVGSSLDGDQIWDGWHPKDKYDVGERLALWALKNEYGRPITATSGPVLRDVTVSGGTLVCSFDHVGDGLMVGSKEWYQPTQEVAGGALDKFSIAGASGAWYDATAAIVGDTVVVSSPSVASPRKVAYACWQNPVGANLYNKVTLDGVANGLPASPFYIDDVTAKYTVTATAGSGGSISPAGTSTYLKRATTLYTITPDAGKFIQSVTVDGVQVGAPQSYTFDPLSANHTISATFGDSTPDFTVTATATGGGTISPGGAVSVTAGGARTFTVNSSPGTIVTLWVDGRSMGPRTSHTFANVRENHTIQATFTFPITAQAGYGGSITPNGETVVTYGSDQTFNITPQGGFTISKVTVDGVNVGAVSRYTFTNVTAAHAITATFTGTGGSGSVPQTGKLYCSFLTDNLPASGNINSWASYLPAGKTLAQQNAPTVEVIGDRKFVKNAYVDSDCLNLGTIASPIPCTGATIVVVAKPTRFGSDPGWTSIVDFFYDRLVLGIMNGTGRVVVRRNGSNDTSTATIPNGQTTILSLVVQQNGTYKVHANGILVMDVTTTSDMSAIVPGVAGGFANNVTFGRNWPDGWTTYNGYYGDSFVYTTALNDPERVELETYLVNRLTASGTSHTINSSAGAGGSITPSGAVMVNDGANQAFTIAPDPGYTIADVLVDGGSVGAVAGHTFTNVTANHTISATFASTGNTPPTISTVADQSITANTSTAVLAFTVGDNQTAAADLTVTAGSSNTTLVPNSNIVLGGSGANRTVRVTPAANQTGTATVTLTVSDGSLTATSTFVVTVTAPPTGGAKAISINVGGFDTAHDVTGTLGVVPVASWNNLTTVASAVGTNLMDDAGATSTMDISFTGWNKDTFNAWGDARADMYSNFLHHQGDAMGDAVVNLAQIPYASYDVYIYYTGFVAKQVQAWTDGVTTLYGLRGPNPGGGLSGYVPYQTTSEATALADAAGGSAGGNYLKFTGLTGSSLTLTSLGLPDQAGFEQDGLAGLQVINTTPANTYATWISGFSGVGSATGFGEDPDGDGLMNGIESYFGNDPSQADGGLFAVAAGESGFKFRHTRSNSPPADVTATYQWTTDLENWFSSGQTGPGGLSVTMVATVVTDAEAPENDVVEVEVTVAPPSVARVFARVVATKAT